MSKSCYSQRILNNRIIKSNQSISSGASFIFSLKAETEEECVNYCCQHSKCNTVVVKLVSGTTVSCYMFDCLEDRVCSYDRHGSFQTLEIVNYYQRNVLNNNNNNYYYFNNKNIYNHNKNSNNKNNNSNNNNNDNSFVIEKNIENNINKEVSNHQNNNNENNRNNNKSSSDDIFCKPGFHKVHNACRKDCPSSLYFECLNPGQPELQQCIAVYDVCDGYQQCIDASDEMRCSNAYQHGDEGPVVKPPNQTDIKSNGVNESNKNNADKQKNVDKQKDFDKQNDEKSKNNFSQHHQKLSSINQNSSTPFEQNPTHFNQNPIYYNPALYKSHTAHLSDRYKKDLKALRFNAMLALALGVIASLIGLVFFLHRVKGCCRHSFSRSKVNHREDYLINGMYL